MDDERPDTEILEELGLPDPDTLEPGGNFSAFMAKAVPTRIRNRALRRLWLSNSVLANVDGLVDYGGDFTDSAMVIENLQTAYQVGKGYANRIAEMAEDAEGEEAESAGSEADTPQADDAKEMVAAEETEADPLELPGDDDAPEILAVAHPDPVSPPPRRMRFRLAEE